VNSIEPPSNLVQQLVAALARPGLDPTTEVAMQELHALVSAELADVAERADYAEVSTEDLPSQQEDDELRREELLPRARRPWEDRANRAALARKM
jgi:hypothetical protein